VGFELRASSCEQSCFAPLGMKPLKINRQEFSLLMRGRGRPRDSRRDAGATLFARSS
jgi:hypothetical protein